MTQSEPTAAQLADALRTMAAALETAPEWLVRNVMTNCAESMALTAKWHQSQRPAASGHPCRHCQRQGKQTTFAVVHDLYRHAMKDHRDLMAARALKAVKAK